MTRPGEPSTLLALRHPGKRDGLIENGADPDRPSDTRIDRHADRQAERLSYRASDRGDDRALELSGAERRERAAIRKVGIWGAALSAAAVLVVSALMGAMRGGG